MAKNNNLKDFITGVANAIREKKGTTELINPQDFENEILTIQTDSEPASGKSLAAQIIDKSVTDVTAGDLEGATKIGDYAFNSCKGLTSITIPNSVASIGEQAFLGCTGLTSVTIGNNVTSIGSRAFYDCSGLTSITVNTGNTKYHSNGNCLIETERKTLILGCKNSVIPSDGSVTSIGGYAFYNCVALASVTIPNSVTSIGDNAFRGCTGLTSITISDSMTSIGYNAFYGCTGLTSVTIPDSMTSIWNYAFGNCTGLTSVKFMGQPPTIQPNTFSGCNNVAKYDFRGATSIPTLSSKTSLGHARGCQIVVPDTLYDSWKAATNWAALTDVVWVKASEYVEE